MNVKSVNNFAYRPPFGALLQDGGTLFSFVSHSASSAKILLYDAVDDEEPSRVIELDSKRDRLGDVWRKFVPEVGAGTLYHFQIKGPDERQVGDFFDERARLVDPYARALTGNFQKNKDGICRPPKCVVVDDDFDWEDEPKIQRNLADEVIYELHVRGFTQSPSSGVTTRGAFLGLIEKIPYLVSLGITAVELMPIHEFPLNEMNGNESRIKNYWGYDPLAFFAPHRGYATSDVPGAQVREFKSVVKEFHKAGVEVFLDVVFNHTAERNEKFDVASFKGFENRNYYLLDPKGSFVNFTGCGNTFNANHPWCVALILDCLRSWVCNYHIDGFRFDLASILCRDEQGRLSNTSRALEAIERDPILANVKLIAEPWDAGGAYQVGTFGGERWAEWNGKYRDDVRRFWRGDAWSLGSFATRYGGSSDLYARSNKKPTNSINFVTSHDGFTLNDLVSYNEKHNLENGENNRDGDNNNFSCNYGYEGETSDPEIKSIRERQVRNFFTTLLTSRGVPMLSAGDEVRRTQKGNNNAYCQDGETTWFPWNELEKRSDLKRFVAELIRFRRREASLRSREFFTGKPRKTDSLPDVAWFDRQGKDVNWDDPNALSLATFIAALDEPEAASRYHIFTMFNASPKSEIFHFPSLVKSERFTWRLFVDTAATPPNEIYAEKSTPLVDVNAPMTLLSRSVRVFISETKVS